MGSVREVFCKGIGCKDLVTGTCEDGEFVTCGVLKCPYSKDFVKGWYAGQKDVLSLVCKRIEGAKLSDEKIIELVTEYHFSGVENRHVLAKNVVKAFRQAILDVIKEE